MISFMRVVVALSIIATSVLGHVDYSCPPWTHYHNSSCECGDTLGGKVKCNSSNKELRLYYCLCMTYDNKTSNTVVGYCPYSCVTNARQPEMVVPMDNEELDSAMCGTWNRQGQLCSKCKPGYGVPLYSYDFHCVQCKEYQITEVFRFLAVSFLPLTLMCIIIILFHINILHPPWSVFVLVSQVITALPVMQGMYSYTKRKRISFTYFSMFSSLFGPWNLDFFRALYKPICISPHISNLESIAIEGSIGLYPLVLLSVLYIQLKLHDRGYRVVTTLCKPFHLCISHFRRSFDIQSSLIDTFATFFILSYIKTGFAAFYILTPARVWSQNGSYEMFLYYDPSVRYFQDFHILYGIVTMLLSLVFHIFPLLVLFLYPFRCFQRCLNHFHLRPLALDVFVDAFQGCYKDGTNGTRDCRYFVSLNILLRATMMLIFSFSQNPTISLFGITFLLSIYVTLFVNAKPYKKSIYNTTDSLTMAVLLLMIVSSFVFSVSTNYPYFLQIWRACRTFAFSFLLLYATFWLFVHIWCVVRLRWRRMHYERIVPLQ